MRGNLPLALYPVASGQEWTKRVLDTYHADNAQEILTGKRARRTWRGFSKSKV